MYAYVPSATFLGFSIGYWCVVHGCTHMYAYVSVGYQTLLTMFKAIVEDD